MKFGGLKFLDSAHVKDVLACFAGRRTHATGWQDYACCSSCPVWARPQQTVFSIGHEPHLQRMYDDVALRVTDLVQLSKIACGYTSRERFLTELTLDPSDATAANSGARCTTFLSKP
jgi:hypothetical protein